MADDRLSHCPHCGQVMVRASRLQVLSPQQRRIYDAVSQGPRTTDQLRAMLYASYTVAPGDKTIHVIINQLNRRLRPFGVRLRNRNRYSYRIEQLNARPVNKSARHIDA